MLVREESHTRLGKRCNGTMLQSNLAIDGEIGLANTGK
jgi:hypothetical protein